MPGPRSLLWGRGGYARYMPLEDTPLSPGRYTPGKVHPEKVHTPVLTSSGGHRSGW